MSNDPKLLGQHETDSIGLHNLLEIRKALQAATTVIVHPLNGVAHTVSGLTAGHFLKALSATTFGFVAHGLTYTDVGALAAGGTAVDSDKLDGQHGSYYLPSASAYTDEKAQDAVGAMIGPSLQYVDATPLLDTIQDLRTTAGPTFTHLHISDVAAITTAAESWVGPSSTAGVYFKGGNVGIGTTTPGKKLTLQDDGTAAQTIAIQNDTLTAGRYSELLFCYSTGAAPAGIRGYAVNLNSNNKSQLRFFTSPSAQTPTERMTIDEAGNVGIGTTTPYAIDGGATTKLHVAGGVGSGGTEVARFEGGTDEDNSYGIVRIGTANDRGFIIKGGRQVGNTSIAIMGLTDYTGTATDIMTFLGSNVGIGTTTPTEALEIKGIDNSKAAIFSLEVTRNDAGWGTIVGQISAKSGGTESSRISFQRASGTYTGRIAFHTVTSNGAALTQRMVIDELGNVGIGTTTPGTLLDVHGTITTYGGDIIVDAGPGGERIRFTNTVVGTKYNWQIGKQINVDNAFEITPSTAVNGTTFSTPAMVFLQSGNVGIGTTTPGELLDVTKSTAAGRTAIRVRNTDPAITVGSTKAGIEFGFSERYGTPGLWSPAGSIELVATGSYNYGGDHLTDMIFNVDDYGYTREVMRFHHGNVGIGTTAPGSPLDVNGAGHFQGSVTATSYVTGSPYFVGDALSKLSSIRGDKKGDIDHATLPKEVLREIYDRDAEGKMNMKPGCDIGMLVMMQTVAIQQLLTRIEKLEGVK